MVGWRLPGARVRVTASAGVLMFSTMRSTTPESWDKIFGEKAVSVVGLLIWKYLTAVVKLPLQQHPRWSPAQSVHFTFFVSFSGVWGQLAALCVCHRWNKQNWISRPTEAHFFQRLARTASKTPVLECWKGSYRRNSLSERIKTRG